MNIYGYNWIWLPTRMAIYARDKYRCLACNRRSWWGAGLSLDHVNPKKRGSNPKNLITLCRDCNTEKGCATVRRWRPDILPRVRAALKLPIDRAKGRKLAEKIKPGWHARHRARNKSYKERLARGETADSFPMLADESYAAAAE